MKQVILDPRFFWQGKRTLTIIDKAQTLMQETKISEALKSNFCAYNDA